VNLEHEFVGVSQRDDRVSARFRNGREAHGDLLVGCDGIRSVVRAELFGAESPHFTGYIAWRGLVPVERLPAALLPLDPESAICIAPGKTITRYLLAQRGLINYVAVAQREGWEVESWAVHSEVADLLDEFTEFHAGIRGILAATPPEHCYKWALFDRDPLERWSVGNITLAGDAAHPMLPFMGQGAVMAIEDAVILARCVDAAQDVATALQRFENARRERCALVMLESRANIVRLQGGNPDTYDKAGHRNEQRLGLFDYDPATVTI
jgi:salicylate hydroxylase